MPSDNNQLAAILKRANEAQETTRKPHAHKTAEPAKVAPVPAKPPGRRSDPAYMQASAYISKEVRRRVTAALALRAGSKDYSELVEELLIQWLENEGA